MTEPTNAEFFRFLRDALAASVFHRSADTLTSFKTTLELALVPAPTDEGPEEGVLLEGVARTTYDAWTALVGGFVMTEVESRNGAHGTGAWRRFSAVEDADAPAPLPALDATDAPALANIETGAAVTEELVTPNRRYVWMGAARDGSAAGWLVVRARRIACRGADSGRSAGVVFREKLALFHARTAERARRAAPA